MENKCFVKPLNPLPFSNKKSCRFFFFLVSLEIENNDVVPFSVQLKQIVIKKKKKKHRK